MEMQLELEAMSQAGDVRRVDGVRERSHILSSLREERGRVFSESRTVWGV